MAVHLGTHFFTGASIPVRTELSISLYATQNQWVTATVVGAGRVARKSKSAVGDRVGSPKARRCTETTSVNQSGREGGSSGRNFLTSLQRGFLFLPSLSLRSWSVSASMPGLR